MSSRLGELQELFSRSLRFDGPKDVRATFFNAIEPAQALSAEDALAIYRSNGTGALLKTLQDVFAVCQQILGEPCFRALAKTFIHATSCQCADLNAYGEDWSDFLAQKVRREPALADFVYLPDLARLEWAWHRAYFAADDQVFDFASFQALCTRGDEKTVYGIRFRLHPALITLCSDYPVFEIWSRHLAGETCTTVDAISQPQAIVVHRLGNERRAIPVERSIHSLLVACAAGQTLGQLLKANETTELAPIMASLPNLFDRGWITGFEAPLPARGHCSEHSDV